MCSSILSEQLFIWIKNINHLKIRLTGTSRVTLTTLWSQAMSLSSAPFELICMKNKMSLKLNQYRKTELLNFNPHIHHLKIEEKRTWIVRSGAHSILPKLILVYTFLLCISLHFFAVSVLNSKKRGPVPNQAGSLRLSTQEFKSVQANC